MFVSSQFILAISRLRYPDSDHAYLATRATYEAAARVMGEHHDHQMGDAIIRYGGQFLDVAESLPSEFEEIDEVDAFGVVRRVALSVSKRYSYAEGLVKTPESPLGDILTPHSWLVDQRGKVVDLARGKRRDYYGVIVPERTLKEVGRLARAARQTVPYVTSYEGRSLLRREGIELGCALSPHVVRKSAERAGSG